MAIDRDWIMRATDDFACREAAFATTPIALPDAICTTTLGAARDHDCHALLMRDITPNLIPQDPVVIARTQLDQIISAMAALHATPPPADAFPWCGLRQRLTLLTPAGAAVAASYDAPVARDITEGWALFARHATPRAAKLIRSLFEDPSPLLRALDAVPPAFLHGDLKLDNIGIDRDGRMLLIDWAMTLIAAPAVELGWVLAINSRRLPLSLDDMMASYAEASGIADRERHDALTVLCGLLLRGWRKALDAEAGEPEELRWWCNRAEEASSFL